MNNLNLKNETIEELLHPTKVFPMNGSVLKQLTWIDEACEYGSSVRNHILRKALQMALQELQKC